MSINRFAIASLTLSASALVGLAIGEGWCGTACIPVPGDVPTIGFGTTEGVKLGDKITPPVALQRALTDIQKFEGALKACVTAPLHQHEYNAYLQLSYNVGSRAFCDSSIPDKLAAFDYAGACKAILDFNKFRDTTKPKVWNAKKQKMEFPLVELRGLTLRRQREYRECIG